MNKMASCGFLLDTDVLNDIYGEVWKAVLFTKMVPCAKTSIQIQMHQRDIDTLCGDVYACV